MDIVKIIHAYNPMEHVLENVRLATGELAVLIHVYMMDVLPVNDGVGSVPSVSQDCGVITVALNVVQLVQQLKMGRSIATSSLEPVTLVHAMLDFTERTALPSVVNNVRVTCVTLTRGSVPFTVLVAGGETTVIRHVAARA